MALTGERFRINLETDEDGETLRRGKRDASLLISDIKERDIANVEPPKPPGSRTSSGGFPEHKERRRPSRFSQRTSTSARQDERSWPAGAKEPRVPSHAMPATNTRAGASRTDKVGDLKQSIHQENRQRIAEMSEEDIEAARKELTSSLNPSLIEKLLRKADMEEDVEQAATLGEDPRPSSLSSTERRAKKVTFDESAAAPRKQLHDPGDGLQASSMGFDPDRPPLRPPPDLQPASHPQPPPLPPGIHFPVPPAPPPTLDPSSPEFLSSLRETYFPNLSADPSAQSWMAPPSASEADMYSATSKSLPATSIRFDFRGRLLPPRLSAQIPVSKGLHHHGQAPESAGYTIPELAHLARSTVPAQRSMAYQTLGRILYRVGRGDFGVEGEDLWDGLWECLEKGRVIDGMLEAAGQEHGNRSVWATATEAIWLWRKGGGRKWKGR